MIEDRPVLGSFRSSYGETLTPSNQEDHWTAFTKIGAQAGVFVELNDDSIVKISDGTAPVGILAPYSKNHPGPISIGLWGEVIALTTDKDLKANDPVYVSATGTATRTAPTTVSDTPTETTTPKPIGICLGVGSNALDINNPDVETSYAIVLLK